MPWSHCHPSQQLLCWLKNTPESSGNRQNRCLWPHQTSPFSLNSKGLGFGLVWFGLNPCLNEQLTHLPCWAGFSFCSHQELFCDNSTSEAKLNFTVFCSLDKLKKKEACQHPNYPFYYQCTHYSLATSEHSCSASGEVPELLEMGSTTRKPNHSHQGSGTDSVQSWKASLENTCRRNKLTMKQAQLSGPQPQTSRS